MKNHRILLVEDDPSLGFIMVDRLTEAGYLVELAKDGQAGYRLFM